MPFVTSETLSLDETILAAVFIIQVLLNFCTVSKNSWVGGKAEFFVLPQLITEKGNFKCDSILCFAVPI